MGDNSLYANRSLIRIGGRSQGCAPSMSKLNFPIPHQDLSRLGGTDSPRCLIFAGKSLTYSSAEGNAFLLSPMSPNWTKIIFRLGLILTGMNKFNDSKHMKNSASTHELS
jgi:hypothetical protein